MYHTVAPAVLFLASRVQVQVQFIVPLNFISVSLCFCYIRRGLKQQRRALGPPLLDFMIKYLKTRCLYVKLDALRQWKAVAVVYGIGLSAHVHFPCI